MHNASTTPRFALALLVAAGCSDGAERPQTTIEPAARAQLQWKRNAALERDLMRALELEADEICKEYGRDSCTRQVHHIALGAADPLTIGLYEPLPGTLVTTPIVLDRVVLSACTQRATMDRAAGGGAAVFAALNLDAAEAPESDDDAFTATVETLYRRLLSRDPEPFELEQMARLTSGPENEVVSAYDFAVLACFTVGTTTEFLFF